MKIQNKKLSLILALFLLSLTVSAYSSQDIATRYIHNRSNQPWFLYFLMSSGYIAAYDLRNNQFQENLKIKIEPGQTIPIYYESPCGSCFIRGSLLISDFESPFVACYYIGPHSYEEGGPYLKHEGVTGPVVLNFGNEDSLSYGNVLFIGDSWRTWSGQGKDKPNLTFGSTCLE